ncbi:oxidoreductase [Leucobacter zeae]|nr:oxidoreductase [Leucobacter zeae]
MRRQRTGAAVAGAAAIAGIAAVALGAGIGELGAGLVAAQSGPFTVIGGWIIDLAPSWAKDLMIALFGTGDKAALLGAIGLVVALAAAGAGVWESRRRRAGAVTALALGLLIGALALTRPDAGALAWAPSAVAGAVAALALGPLVRLAVPAGAASPTSAAVAAGDPDGAPGSGSASTPSRRSFILFAGSAAAVGALAAVGGTLLRAGTAAATAVREAIRLPRPAVPAPPIPAGAELAIDGLAPLVTPNGDFYRIDTALTVPDVDPADWELRIHGMVEQEVRLTWDELLALPLVESAATLSCVSNEVGGDLVGNALWLGYPIRELLARARPLPRADMALSRSVDGFTAGTPLEALTDDRGALLAVGMNGEPLPRQHGFPVRMVVPGLYGYVSATKWVVDIEVTRFDRARAYWTDRGWSARGPIKLQSRIDVPRAGAAVPPGDAVIAGVAWQPGTGVAAVEVRIDDLPWQRAELAPAISQDTWVQWRLPWRAAPGPHRIACRAISATREVQTGRRAFPAPDGATGWHAIEVTVADA